MTEENFNYRTNPLFLRNEFNSSGKWKIPLIPKPNADTLLIEDLRAIGFNQVKNGKDTHYNRLVHFFLYDYNFEKVWTCPEKYTDILKKYRGILSPDFSMYIEMNPVMQLYNTFRNRWVGAYFAARGISVVPTVNWGLENTFDGNVSEFKRFKGENRMEERDIIYIDHFDNFESISDFKWCMKCGGEVEFVWKGKSYSITHVNGKIYISEGCYVDENGTYRNIESKEPCFDFREMFADTADEALEYIMDGDKLRDVITKIEIDFRSI